jgi:hypothetical protein
MIFALVFIVLPPAFLASLSVHKAGVQQAPRTCADNAEIRHPDRAGAVRQLATIPARKNGTKQANKMATSTRTCVGIAGLAQQFLHDQVDDDAGAQARDRGGQAQLPLGDQPA